MEKTFQPGEKIIREGESGTSAFWLKKGRVEVSREFDGHHIVLAILDKHSPLFGEMSLIDEKPRSATVTAIEPCVVEEITAELLHQDLGASSRPVQLLIGLLVDRVRGMNEHVLASGISLVQTPIRTVTLSGSGKGAEALNQKPLLIERFPFKIGRKSSRGLFSLGQRNLELEDEPPFNVSRVHCSITRVHQDIFVVDEGSALGTIVNGTRIGGPSEGRQARCDQQENRIILGSPHSPFHFCIAVERQN